ncbi:helix-turn-helix transcriptional regulator [Acinetobacter baumannii]|uniref:helix-turn-helix domain-containing protein n=1 Tax=Acinetobacter baumannii TaxID=470 RepID=UPI003B84DBCE
MAHRDQIGEKVKEARKSKGYTQQKLSKLTRINKTTISEIENGRFTGSFDIFERILDEVAYSLLIDHLFSYRPDQLKSF